MGGTSSHDGLKDLRKEVVGYFNGQKLLLVGREGSGKSSLINSFSMALHLGNPDHKWREWAPIGPQDTQTTMMYRKYHVERLYTGLDHLLDGKPADKCPTLFDTAGFSGNDLIPEAKLLTRIAAGDVPEGTNLRGMLTEEFKFEAWLQTLKHEEDLQSWSILYVVSAGTDFSREVADICYQAWQNLEAAGKDVRIFVIITWMDKVREDQRPGIWEALQSRLTTVLRIPSTRVYQILNFTPADVNEDRSVKVNVHQRKLILRAMSDILNPANRPDWKVKAESTAAAVSAE